MKLSKLLILALAVTGLAIGTHAQADGAGDHSHDHKVERSEDGIPKPLKTEFESPQEALLILEEYVGKADTAIKADEFDEIHWLFPTLETTAKHLVKHLKAKTPGQQTRLNNSLAQLTEQLDEFHMYSHSGEEEAENAKRSLKKVKGALRLLKAQAK